MRRPEADEAAPYYSRYIDLVPGDNILDLLEKQLDDTQKFLADISEERSLQSYAPEKWTIRQVVSHVNDTERVFLFRAVWFARGFPDALPGFDQDICVEAAEANGVPWSDHIAEFRNIRLGCLSFFNNLPDRAWSSTGIASDKPFTVRSLAYIIAGHVKHHTEVIKARYLG